ncbi:MAG: alpha-glucosidase [Bacilli bacterium]|jgi:oligo-1,6-glucosidase
MLDNKFYKNNVVYQIYPRSFCDSNGDGIGDIQGIISKLPYLKDLGIGIIWLSPVYKSPNADFGYDVSSYYDINPEYGSMGDMKELIEKANRSGMRIVMDLVINHTSIEHEWFIKSKEKESPYRDYYFWRLGRRDNHKAPNNWQSLFADKAWKHDEKTDLWYLHLYSEEQADLNYRNPQVIKEVEEIMKYWLSLGVYGFRMDVINNIFKTSLNDGKRRLFETGRELYADQEGCHLLLQRFKKDVFDAKETMTIGECYRVSIAEAKRYVPNELDMIFHFDHMYVDRRTIPVFIKKFSASRFKRILFRWQEEIEWNANYFENHDQPRSLSRFGSAKYRDESSKALAMFLLTLRGTSFIYQGEEIGMANHTFNRVDEFKDVLSINVFNTLKNKLHYSESKALKIVNDIGRDNARTPMRWNSSNGGGFSTGVPWLPFSQNSAGVNVSDQENNPDSILSFYKALIRIKKEHSALCLGDFHPLHTRGNLISYARNYLGSEYQVVINLGSKAVPNPLFIRGRVLLSNYGRDDYEKIDRLLPYECALIKLR